VLAKSSTSAAPSPIRWLRDRPKATVCSLLAVAGTLAVLASFYPGYMSADSISQLAAARSGRLTDWHPPLMTLLWGLLDRVWRGPPGLILLHGLLLWSGVALIAGLACSRTVSAALALLAVGFFPAVLALLGTAWKDVAFGCSMTLAIAFLLLAQLRRKRWAAIGATPLLFYALSVRHEGVLSVIPVCAWAGILGFELFPRSGRPLRHARPIGAAVGLVLGGLFLAADAGVTRLAVGTSQASPEQVAYDYDLAYLSVVEGRWLLPDEPGSESESSDRLARFSEAFKRQGCLEYYCFAMYDLVPPTKNPAEVGRLRRVWWSVLQTHFRAFVRMKWSLAKNDYGFMTPQVLYPFHRGIDKNELGVSLRVSALNARVMDVLIFLQDSVVFRAWVYFLLLVLFIPALAWLGLREHLGALLVAVGALAKELLYLAWWPGYDFRYHWWTVLCVLLLPFFVLAVRRTEALKRSQGP
jgi:hypothetical protein